MISITQTIQTVAVLAVIVNTTTDIYDESRLELFDSYWKPSMLQSLLTFPT